MTSRIGNPWRRNWRAESTWLRTRATDIRTIYKLCDEPETVERLMRLESLLLKHADEIDIPVRDVVKS